MTKKVLVLDLDETLIYSSKEKLSFAESFIYQDYYVYERPNLKWFLNHIKFNFNIGIWSSADDLYVEYIVDKIIPKDINLKFIWSKSWFNYDAYDGNQYLKKLTELVQFGYRLDELILIDDTPKNSIINAPHSILVKPYRGSQGDTGLLKVYEDLKVKL